MSKALAIGALCTVLFLSGCVMHSTTPEYPSAPQTIYRISEREAFISILEIYVVELPKQSVDDVVEDGYRGYSADARFGPDWTTHRVLVIPVKGTDQSGLEVRGYRYDIHSSGSRAFENPIRHKRIREMIQKTLAKAEVVVTNVQRAEYETDGKAYLGLKRDARDIKVQELQPPDTRAADRLAELKAMRDRGLITEQEYQTKRRQILDAL